MHGGSVSPGKSVLQMDEVLLLLMALLLLLLLLAVFAA